MSGLSEQQLAEIRTRLERARTTAGLGLWADGEYETIVAALADVPALLAEVKRLREQVADLEVERAKLVRWHEEDARQLRRWGLRVAKTQQQVKDAQSRATELEQQPAVACAQCEGPVGWIYCPTGGWWAHREHPADGHDAQPIPAAALAEGR